MNTYLCQVKWEAAINPHFRCLFGESHSEIALPKNELKVVLATVTKYKKDFAWYNFFFLQCCCVLLLIFGKKFLAGVNVNVNLYLQYVCILCLSKITRKKPSRENLNAAQNLLRLRNFVKISRIY